MSVERVFGILVGLASPVFTDQYREYKLTSYAVIGYKVSDNDNGFWDDHDEDVHGTFESHKDDPDFANGFLWSCCDELGSHEGCKQTKHKAPVNRLVNVSPAAAEDRRKRKREESLDRPVTARCEQCDVRFEVNDNDDLACPKMQHDGQFPPLQQGFAPFGVCALLILEKG